MNSLLIRNADVAVTMDHDRRELQGVDIAIESGVIRDIGYGLQYAAKTVISAEGCVVTPGLVNTHHHLSQVLTRALPAGQDAPLFGWLKSLYPIWSHFGPDHFFAGVQLGLAELVLSGCTMSSDHQYLFPNGARLDDSIAAAREIGIRFHATRGAMTVGESSGGLPPDHLIEPEDQVLEDCVRVVDTFHDASAGAMVRVALAPCSPFTVSPDLMRETAVLAREKGVRLHTHLAENDEDIAYSLEHYDCLPGQFMQELDWLGDDVWHAHCVKLNPKEIDLFAATRTGVAHCPTSNGRLGSGIAPIRAMRDAGISVGLGVDGSASNDSGHMLSEARQALLMQRVKHGADAMSARETLEMATLGGARILGRDECGALAVGKRADIAIWNIDTVTAAGNWDPVAALVLCGPFQARDVIVEGNAVVRDFQLLTADVERIVQTAQSLQQALIAH
ncbi:MAG: 8-oxoguanine deaminase [Hyphomicrobiaceae bacterium]